MGNEICNGCFIFDAGAFRRQPIFIGNLIRRNLSIAVALNHRERATGEIAEAAREIAVRAIDQVFISKAAVLPEDHLAQNKIANGVDRKELVQHVELDRITEGLRHLATRRIDPHAMSDNGARLLNARSQKERGPVHGVKAQDVFANQVQRRPELFKANRSFLLLVAKADGRDVVRQRVEPDVHGVVRIIRNRNPPTDRRPQATDGKILQPTGYETLYLVTTTLRTHEVSTRVIKFQQGL